jgi:hypothetical protein
MNSLIIKVLRAVIIKETNQEMKKQILKADKVILVVIRFNINSLNLIKEKKKIQINLHQVIIILLKIIHLNKLL